MEGNAVLGNLLPILDAELWAQLESDDAWTDSLADEAAPPTWADVQGFAIAPPQPAVVVPQTFAESRGFRIAPDAGAAGRQQQNAAIDWFWQNATEAGNYVNRWVGLPARAAGLIAGRAAEGIAQAVTFPQRAAERYGDDWYAATHDPAMAGEALNFTGLLSLGPLGAPRGALGSGMTRPYRPGTTLPMDDASRMARAADMGFDISRPVYHGTNTAFPAFGSNTSPLPNAVSVAVSPAIADEFALMRAGSQGNAQTYPLMTRSDRRGQIVLDGTENHHEVLATLAQAFDAGYDSVLLRNYSSPNGLAGQDIIWVKDPSQLRSVFANFDPSKRSSSDLLAAAGIPIPLAPFPDTLQQVRLPGGSTVAPLPDLVSQAMQSAPPVVRPPLGPAWAAEYHAAYQNPNSPEFAARVAREAAAAEAHRLDVERRAREQAIRDGWLIEA